MSVALVQIRKGSERAVGLVEGRHLRLLRRYRSVYELAASAIRLKVSLAQFAHDERSDDRLDYDEVYACAGALRILPSADHPDSMWRTLVSGTGLTHMASVERRNAMHAAAQADAETDSMRMYRWGMEAGKPDHGSVGVAPEWFYKGSGAILRGHGDPLEVPPFAEDGGEEPEIAGVYLIDDSGNPRRIGLTVGNEFSDHKFERRNYLYLAHSKLRTCAIGPELMVDADFEYAAGTVSVQRDGSTLWSSPIRTGERVMCHSLANIEHHHFKYPQHRVPGDLHIHFFGADAFSFGSGIELRNDDVMEIGFEGYGRPLRNPLRLASGPDVPVEVRPA